ncbi:hypothetical protein ACLVWU_00565 [Bdellovibrio sp. HCB290]|uniref:hypothetical protein n=1 Tax=Bdellovibrio sp. HCB290 TaxID=3394356 RepID=UPI0039B5F8C5
MKMHSLFTLMMAISLLGSVSHAQSSLEGFSTGRYEVRKGSTPAKLNRNPAQAAVPEVSVTLKEDKTPAATETQAVATPAASVETSPAVVAAPAPTPVPAPTAVKVTPVSTAAPVVASESPAPAVVEPSIAAQAEALFTNKADKIYDYYAETIHPDDIRNNRLEVEISPMAVYNDSQSNYSFRDYQSFYNALRFKANVWLTPLIGVSGKFIFSLGSDIDSMEADGSRVAVKYEQFDVGLNFRKYFGTSRKANSLEFALLYSDSKMKPPTDAANRVGISTSGLGIGMKVRVPSSIEYAWVYGGTFFPRLQHSELGNASDIHSGSVGENSRLALELGGEWRLSRSSQILWGLEASAEKNMFDGSASQPDPSTGATPKNVSVTNSACMFSLGYRWGN